jgi:isoleucyl-tRNA synthetase
MDYKNSVNLPQTDFPMQANLAKREPEFLKSWQNEQPYQQALLAAAGQPAFRLIDGPPYANGDLHIGHALNKILKDIIVKSARLDGKHAAFIPGWDCHGLPIEAQVEKKYGRVGEKLDAAAFRAQCRQYAAEQVERQKADFIRMGVLADWDKPYLTMHPRFEAEQLRCLAKIIDNGHVVPGFRPVHWCLDCGSSLAEAEVEYQNKTSTAIDVAFQAVDSASVAACFGVESNNVAFPIWTTTPWTIPANQAICLNAELPYVLVQIKDRTLVVAEGLVASFAQRLGAEAVVMGEPALGATLEGLLAVHPLNDRQVPIILGEHVTLEAGTGLVHTAPAHGEEDFQVGKKYGLGVEGEANNPLQNSGKYAESTPLVGGMHVKKVESVLLQALGDAGALVHQYAFQHEYPHCWRHKTPLIFRATPQWFVSMDKAGLRTQALAEIKKVTWIPAWGEERIHNMIRDRGDWCISRQRTWGVPLAVFYHQATQALHPDMPALLHKIAAAVEERGLEAWFGSTVEDWLGKNSGYVMCRDTLDVWFDSGVVHQASWRAVDQDIPDESADFYLEGSDQHRGWFHSSLLTSVAMFGRAPYKNVLTHGFTVDEKGQKMSKSLGNVVAPQEVIKELGADVLRLWAAASDYSGEVKISKDMLKRMADAYRRIRNTVRFALSNLYDFDASQHLLPLDQLLLGDQATLARAAEVQGQIRAAYAGSTFHEVYHLLHNYCVNDLGGLYLDVIKDRLYTLQADSKARRSAQTTLHHLVQYLLRWMAPILSFTADEIWKNLKLDGNVFSARWYDLPALPTPDLSLLLSLREQAKKQIEDLRKAGEVGSSLEAELQVTLPADHWTASLGDELRFWFLVSKVTIQAGEPAISVTKTVHAKCERCWHHREDVGQHADHPTICGRCVDNLTGGGETRTFI